MSEVFEGGTMLAVDFVDVMATMGPMADPTADYWTIADIAEHWHVSQQTVRSYRSRGKGELPKEDRMFGRSPVWKPATIINFVRPGQGARTDLPPSGPKRRPSR